MHSQKLENTFIFISGSLFHVIEMLQLALLFFYIMSIALCSLMVIVLKTVT